MDKNLVNKINRYFHDEEAKSFSSRHELRMSREKTFYENFFSGFPAQNARMLDIGSGTGLVASALPRDAGCMILTDISPEMIKKAKDALGGKTGIQYVVCDAADLPFEDGIFDLVTCNAAMHHFPVIDDFAAEVDRVLKKGGTVVLSFEANNAFWNNLLLSSCYRLAAKLRPSAGEVSAVSYDKICGKVNERLISDGVIRAPMSTQEIMGQVDIHSPNAGDRIDYSKGFLASDFGGKFFRGYSRQVIYHYHGIPRFLAILTRLFFPYCAPKFSLILKKGMV